MGCCFSKKDLNKNYNKQREKIEKILEKREKFEKEVKKTILINNLINEIVLLSNDTKFNNYLLKKIKKIENDKSLFKEIKK
jgi:hypothetical protein